MKRMEGLQIQTKSACTSTCVFCPHPDSWHNRNPGEMTDETFDKILSEVDKFWFEKVCPYLMNEPLSDKKIFDRIEAIKSRCNFDRVSISTNANILDERRSEELIRVLEDVSNDVWISFHGTDIKTYKEIMGANFERTLENIRRFLIKSDGKLKLQIKGTGQPHIPTDNCPSWFSRDDFLVFWNKIFDELRIRNRPELFYFEYNDRAGNIGRLSFSYQRESLEGFSCNRTSDWLHFLYTGEIVLCCNDYQKEHILGDIRSRSLEENLQGEQRITTINMIEGRKDSPDNFICKRCDQHLS